MAINAIIINGISQGCGHPAGYFMARTVAALASLREQSDFPRLIFMHIMAGNAGELAHPEAFTGSEQSILIPMHIDTGCPFL
jgi:hypothetical protein